MKHRLLLLVVLLSLAVGCVWETDLPADAKAIPIARGRELVIVDDAVVAGPLAKNATGGPLSFRRAMEGLGLAEGATRRWLDEWSRRLRDEAEPARAAMFDDRVTCRWLRRVPENRCDSACASCAATTLRLEDAPFRLIAITNRTDLSDMPDRAADGGEGRLVFALTDGPGDDATSSPLPMTVIFEYAQVGSALDWAKRWHALGAISDADFPDALVTLTQTFVAAGALAQLRTADAFTGSTLVLHQFQLDARSLVASNVRNTPDWKHVSSAAVGAWAQANTDAIKNGTHVVPKSWWASGTSPTDVRPDWVTALPEHDALVLGTCGGCHAKSANGFHIDPLASGDLRLSRFLLDSTKDQDELGRRAEWMRLTLWCGGG